MFSLERFPTWLGGVLLAFVAGMATMRHIDRRPAKPEPHAEAVAQEDGSLILERNPDRKPPALPELPVKSKVTRVTTVELHPIAPRLNQETGSIVVQLTQIETPKGSRVIASTEDGQIVGGADWTEPARITPKPYRWELGAVRSFGPRGSAWGGFVGYSRGPMVGLVSWVPGPAGTLQVGLGFRW